MGSSNELAADGNTVVTANEAEHMDCSAQRLEEVPRGDLQDVRSFLKLGTDMKPVRMYPTQAGSRAVFNKRVADGIGALLPESLY